MKTTRRQTMRYVHVAAHHRREILEVVQRAGEGARDLDARVLAMLSVRGEAFRRGNAVANDPVVEMKAKKNQMLK